MLRPRPVKQ